MPSGFLHRDIKPANIMVDDQRPADPDRFRRLARGDGGTFDDADGDLHAGLCRGRAVHLVQSRPVDRHLRSCRHALPRHHRANPAERDRTHPERHLRAAERAAAAGLSARRCSPASTPAWRCASRIGRRASPNGATCCGPRSRRLSQEATRVTHKPGRLARAASRSRQARVTIRGPALWSAAAAAILVLAGGGYLAYQANAPGTVSTAALSLSAEQLEQALAERRKADALAAEKRRLEDEARQKAEAETEAKRQAEAELEQARQARQKAEDELATLKADIEARRQSGADPQGQAEAAKQRAAEEDAQRKAEAEAAALRQAEEEAGKKAAADAEAKRQADEALARAEAERQRADADARAKAEAETAARRQASDEAQRKAAADAASKRQADEAQAKAQAEREKADAEAKAKAEAETAERGAAPGERGPPAPAGRADVARLRYARQRRRLRAALARDDRGLAEEGRCAGDRVPDGGSARPACCARRRQRVARWDDEQKKAEEQKKLEEERKKTDAAKAAAAVPPLPSPAPVGPSVAAIPQPNASAAPAEAARRAQQPDASQQATSTAPIRASASLAPSDGQYL